MVAFLALLFVVAGAGLAAYFLWKSATKLTGDVPAAIGPSQPGDQERILRDIRLKGAAESAGSSLRGIAVGMSQQEVLDKMGEPAAKERGYKFVEGEAPVPREVWAYRGSWVMFRYDRVVESGAGSPPILSKQLGPGQGQ